LQQQHKKLQCLRFLLVGILLHQQRRLKIYIQFNQVDKKNLQQVTDHGSASAATISAKIYYCFHIKKQEAN